jgi:2',3'-cyclic-nucleotide 2'-phosphodiesterase/3'-nucleotidase/5'-nucleotidase
MIKKTTVLVLMLALILSLTPVANRADAGVYTLAVMHTNDTHGHLEDIARRATAISRVRRDFRNSLLLDAGDVLTGTLYSSKYKGMADVDFMNTLGYDAMCTGNHEFDNGPEGLAAFVKGARFPVLNANFDFSADPSLKGLSSQDIGEAGQAGAAGRIFPAVLISAGGEKIGVIGVTTETTKESSSPGKSIQIESAAAAVENSANRLMRKGINKVIVLSHLGWDQDLKLASAAGGIDVVVGGHTHTKPDTYPAVVNGKDGPVLVVQANEYGRYLGVLTVTFDDRGIVIPAQSNGELIDVTAKDQSDFKFGEDDTARAKLARYSKALEQIRSDVVAEASVALEGARDIIRTRETNLGNLVADSMLEKAAPYGASVAIVNGGGVRSSLKKGPISVGDVITVLPFNSYLMVAELTGEQIVEALENGVSQVETKAGRFPQVAGLRYGFDPSRPAGKRIAFVLARDKDGYRPLDKVARYRVAATNFLVDGGDGYTMFKNASKITNLGHVDWEVLTDYLRKHSPVGPQVEDRITVAPMADMTPVSIKIEREQLDLWVGQTGGVRTLSVRVEPATAAANIVCTSSDKDRVKAVYQPGRLTLIPDEAGPAVITLRSPDGACSARCVVWVSDTPE